MRSFLFSLLSSIALISSCSPKEIPGQTLSQSGRPLSDAENAIINYLTENGSGEAVSHVLDSRREFIASATDSSKNLALTSDNTLYKIAVCAKIQLGFIIGSFGGKKGIAQCIDFDGKPFWIDVNAGTKPLGLTVSLNGVVGAIVFQDHGIKNQVYGEFGIQAATVVLEAAAFQGAKWAIRIAKGIKGVGVSGDLMFGNSNDYGPILFLGLGVGGGADLSTTEITISQKAPN